MKVPNKTKMIIKITNACIANVGTILEISENGFVEIMLYLTPKVYHIILFKPIKIYLLQKAYHCEIVNY